MLTTLFRSCCGASAEQSANENSRLNIASPTILMPKSLENVSGELIVLRHNMMLALQRSPLVGKKYHVVLMMESSAKMRILFEANPKVFMSNLNQTLMLAAFLGNRQVEIFPITEGKEQKITINLEEHFSSTETTQQKLEKMFTDAFLYKKSGTPDFAIAFAESRKYLADKKAGAPVLRMTLTNSIPEIIGERRQIKGNSNAMQQEFLKTPALVSDHIIALGATSAHRFPFLEALPKDGQRDFAVTFVDKKAKTEGGPRVTELDVTEFIAHVDEQLFASHDQPLLVNSGASNYGSITSPNNRSSLNS